MEKAGLVSGCVLGKATLERAEGDLDRTKNESLEKC